MDIATFFSLLVEHFPNLDIESGAIGIRPRYIEHRTEDI